jgi:hypothetical protein
MFCGTFYSQLGKRRRLVIPVGLGDDICGEQLVLRKGEDDCLEIHTEAHLLLFKGDRTEEIFVVKCEPKKRRITIPEGLLVLNSFYLGDKVTLEGKGSYIRVLPRPS